MMRCLCRRSVAAASDHTHACRSHIDHSTRRRCADFDRGGHHRDSGTPDGHDGTAASAEGQDDGSQQCAHGMEKG